MGGAVPLHPHPFITCMQTTVSLGWSGSTYNEALYCIKILAHSLQQQKWRRILAKTWSKYRVTQKKRELLKNRKKIEEIQGKKFIERNLTITTCLLRDSNPHYQCLKLRPVDGVLLHVCILSLPLRISKVPVLLCHFVCVACSAECDRVAFCRMHTWRRTPSTGRNFQTLIIWITVS